ncbi:hypothetical protein [Candidatus Reidiella endopervernicosa]|uniref:Uncharacterized protein n=1 Tax=Candidatus Reidiella endopervernicosa TaxID=2738883 RepID=A0A6N0I0Q2_9GAMM|nr:hypothetical protein HUE57_04135 [Candidatus Reidiella endopervernicosa]
MDSAIESSSIYKPKRILMLAIGLTSGLMLSIAIAFLMSACRKKHVV